MKCRPVLIGLLVIAVTLGTAAAVPAQTPTRKVFEITAVTYKFEPSVIVSATSLPSSRTTTEWVLPMRRASCRAVSPKASRIARIHPFGGR